MKPERLWLLSFGHTAPMLEHERSGMLPSRPRMCGRCGRLRDVEAPAPGAGALVCVECGTRSVDGAGWKAEVAPDILERKDDDEVAVYCAACWKQEVVPVAPEGR